MCAVQVDEDDGFEGLFENGHWEWDDIAESLVFISDLLQIEDDFSQPNPTLIGSVDFKEDIDLLEEQRFRKRFQRRTMENDVIHLQDVKDVVCFTAPKAFLTPAVINILHLPLTERFLRALILYCQYFLQISDTMSTRMLELHVKVRNSKCEETELEFRENLEDLRLLVAKEYYSMIMGNDGFAKYHHMGGSRKMRSLTKRDSILFESILRISIQIVWLALGRKSYNQIELEIHRLFKSDFYNLIERKLHTTYASELSEREIFVLFGQCVHRNRMINTYSPLKNQLHCNRDIDYRILGLGAIKYPRLNYRLRYLEHALIAPEIQFNELKVTLGILGLQRVRFDTMLRELTMPAISTASSSSSLRHSSGRLRSTSRTSRGSTSMKKSTTQQKLYADIYIPEKYKDDESLPDQLPSEVLPKKHCNEEQRRRWLSYVSLLSSRRNKQKKCVNNKGHTKH